MRAGFDISCLKAPMGGYERYARALLAALAALPGDHELVVFTERRYGPGLIPADPRFHGHALATLPLFIAKVLLQDQTYWPALMRRAHLDLVHTPIFAGMARPPRPYVLTLHDLIPLHARQTLTRLAAWYWHVILPRAVARADLVITVSQFSRAEICSHFRLPPERVRSIPLGVAPHFRPVQDAATLAAVRARYRLPDDFLLFVGILSPRKNVDRLVRAFAALPAHVRGATHLVLAGPPGWKNAALERVLAGAAGACVRRLGVVADADLPALYALARGAVNLSSYEGFGLPALEAHACGTPLLCADASAFPEVVGDCALLVDPCDQDAVAARLIELLAGGPRIAAMRARGRVRAATFTWEKTAVATLAVYREVVGRS